MATWPTLVVCALIALYLYIKKCKSYWEERGIVTVNSDHFLSNAFSFLTGRRSLEQMHEDLYRAKPDEPYVGTYNGLHPILFIRDPELIQKITVKDFSYFHSRVKDLPVGGPLIRNLIACGGEEWKAMRNKLLPSFSSSKLKNMYGMIEECAEKMIKYHFRPSIATREAIEIVDVAKKYSLDVLGKCTFGLQFNTLEEFDSFFLKMANTMNNTGIKNTFRIFLSFIHPRLLKVLRMRLTSTEVEKFFFDLLRNAEELRRNESNHRGDFLQLMLDTKYASSNEASECLFTDDVIVSNMFLFYIAGHETTSLTITFALYEIVRRPDVQEKLQKEVDETKNANNGVLDYDAIKKMVYLEMVVSETLRLHPITTLANRVCTTTYQIPDSPHIIEAGEQILYSILAIHRDEKYYPDPMKFDPERFSTENIARINPNAYLPFGSGPRICIGLRFAKLMVNVCLASIFWRFKLSFCDKSEVPIVMNKRTVLHAPANGLWLLAEEI